MVQNFKQEDFILLESELQEALSLSQKSFEVHIMAFDGVPNYEDHIAEFVRNSDKISRYDRTVSGFKFHIV